MFVFRQFAAPAALGLTMALGVAGCASERHAEIPPTATMAVEGDQALSYAAPGDGTVYVYDAESDRMVYSGEVKEGDIVTVDPEADRIAIGGRTVFEEGIHSGNRHRVFFEGDAMQARTVIERTTVSEQQRPQPDPVVVEERTIRRPAEENPAVIEQRTTIREQPEPADQTVIEERTLTVEPAEEPETIIEEETVIEEETTIRQAD